MYKLEFTLKQHTPLIHFQHDQDGATLRASEVKPKLDRFIIEKLEMLDGKGKPKPEFEGWINKSERLTLDYRLKIESRSSKVFDIESVNERGRIEKFPAFFGLLGKEKSPDKKFQYSHAPSIEFFSFHKILLDSISSSLDSFFLMNNFGTRASKGFGSFTSGENARIKNSMRFTIDTGSVNVRLKLDDYEPEFRKFYKLFYAINLFYTSIKSGINQYDKGNRSFYFKSMLFLYFKEKYKAQWDKKAIKQNFFREELKVQQKDHKYDDILAFEGNTSFLVRDLLGLSTESTWKAGYNDVIIKEAIPSSSETAGPVKIERFRSPITFKPIEKDEGVFEVYLLLDDEMIRSVLGKTFKLTSKKYSKSFEIDMPKVFDLCDYFQFLATRDISKHIKFKYSAIESDDSVLLKRIYKDLKTTL